MGGSHDRIWLADLEGDESAKQVLLSFDALKAKCFVPKDRERLLAVIESGYGDCLVFNKTVRSIFAAAMPANSKDSYWSAV